MICQCCKGKSKLVEVSAKCSDMFWSRNVKSGMEYDGYVPEWIGANGYGDYVNFTICRHCGHVQGSWPHYDESIKQFKHGKAI